MAYAQSGQGLPIGKSFAHTGKAVRHIVAQAVVFAGVYSYYKVIVLPRYFNQLVDHGAQLSYIVDLLADYVATRNIRVVSYGADYAELALRILESRRLISNYRQRNTPDSRQKANQYARFLSDGGHYLMNLHQHISGALRLYKRCVRNFRIADASPSEAARYPQQLVLKKRHLRVNGIITVAKHLMYCV